jgi:hypothetical protein
MPTLAIALLAASLALPAAAAIAQTFEADNGAKVDCHGHYLTEVNMVESDWHSIPPRSVLAQISRSVCKR